MTKGVFHKLTTFTTLTTNGTNLEVGERFFKWEWTLFGLILVLFPANLAKHFELSSAYVYGVLVDYLLPKIHLTELLVLFLLVLTTFRLTTTRRLKVRFFLPLLFLLPFLPSLFAGGSFLPSFVRLAELALWGGFALWVKERVRWDRDWQSILRALSLGTCWVSLLALAQFLRQGNIFGYYFLGEPLIYPSLGGVAKASFFGREVLRAYGTFPHPNVLGGAMALVVPWFLAEGYLLSAGLGLLALLVSFSRSALICFLLGLFLLGILKAKGLLRVGLSIASLPVFILASTSFLPAATDLSLVRRVELLQSAWAMVRASPLAGVGLGLFTAKLPAFGLPSGPTLFLQPVHNIFALVAAESGLLALSAVLVVFVLAAKESWRRRRLLFLISLGQLLLLGSLDHYLYTLPQGLFLLSLTLGLTFSNTVRKRGH